MFVPLSNRYFTCSNLSIIMDMFYPIVNEKKLTCFIMTTFIFFTYVIFNLLKKLLQHNLILLQI